MAFTEFYCGSAGANINAGDGAALTTSTNGDWGNAAVNRFTAASGTPFSAVAVGDWASVYLDGATVAVYIARVTAVGGSGAYLTLSSTAKSGTAPTTGATGRSCTVGGVWLGPNGTSSFPFGFVQSTMTNSSSHMVRVNFKNDAVYSITAAMAHGNNGQMAWEGYTTSAGDGGLAIIDGGTSGAAYVLLAVSGTQNYFRSFWFRNNGASSTASGVTSSGVNSVWERCRFSNVRGAGLSLTGAGRLIECEAHTCNGAAVANTGAFATVEEGAWVRCWSHDNSAAGSVGFVLDSSNAEPISMVFCVSENNASDGYLVTSAAGSTALTMIHCAAVNNGGDGIDITGLSTANSLLWMENCVWSDNGGYGINGDTAAYTRIINNAFYSNASGGTTALHSERATGGVTLSSDPFTDAANGDLSANNTAGAGASLRGAAADDFLQDGAVYSGTTSSARDIGPTQHADSGGGTGIAVLTGGGLVK